MEFSGTAASDHCILSEWTTGSANVVGNGAASYIQTNSNGAVTLFSDVANSETAIRFYHEKTGLTIDETADRFAMISTGIPFYSTPVTGNVTVTATIRITAGTESGTVIPSCGGSTSYFVAEVPDAASTTVVGATFGIAGAPISYQLTVTDQYGNTLSRNRRWISQSVEPRTSFRLPFRV